MNKLSVPKYAKVKLGKCPRCQCTVKQALFDYNYAIYKCTKCGNIHA